MPDEGWATHFVFPNKAPDFAFGFACGRLWEQMISSDSIDGTFPSECRETIEAMAMSFGWVEEITVVADGWIRVVLSRPD